MGKTTKALLLVLFVAGAVAALGKVFIWGESVTNYGSYTPWGLWVSLYVLMVAAAAGAAWTGIYVAWSQGGEPKRLTTISLIAAGAFLAFGLGFIGTDLGKPMKGFLIFFSPAFSSKLAWASWLYMVFFVSLGGYLFTQAKKAFMYLAGLAAVAFVLAEGLFFGGMVARAAWNSVLTPISFLASAAAAGSSVVLAVGQMHSAEIFAEEGYTVKRMMICSVIAVAVIELIHAFAGQAGILASVPFWGFVVLGVVVPLFMLYRGTGGATPGLLVLFGLACSKYAFIREGFAIEPLPGLSSAFQTARLSLSYTPSAVEWVVAIGFVAGAIWAADFLANKLLAAKQA